MRNQSHRFIYTFAVSVIAAILAVVALTSGVVAFTSPDGSSLSTFTLFRTCQKSLLQGVDQIICTSLDLDDLTNNTACSEFDSRWEASRGIGILATIVVILLAIVAFIRMVKHFSLGSFVHKCFLGLNILAFVLTLIAFPVIISIYTATYCSVAFVTIPSIGIGNCGEMMSVSFGAVLVTLMIECFYRPSSDDAAALEGSNPEGMEYTNYGATP